MNYDEQRFEALAALVPRTDAVNFALNLILPLDDPGQMKLLLSLLFRNRPDTERVLKSLNFVHSARFLPTPDGSALQVITVYDGDFDDYVNDFTAAIGDTFDLILSFVRDHPPLPVRENPEAFLQFINAHNRVGVQAGPGSFGPMDHWPLYTAYADKTVLDIVDPASLPPLPIVNAKPHPFDDDDIQCNILADVKAGFVQHLGLNLGQGAPGRHFLARLLDGGGDALPQVSSHRTACDLIRQDCGVQAPDTCLLTVGLTADGLTLLSGQSDTLEAFPPAFRRGPADPDIAIDVGDIHESAPDRWILGAPGQMIHLFLSVYADADDTLTYAVQKVTSECMAFGGTVIFDRRITRQKKETGHFGYREGISQPRIAGIHPVDPSDPQPLADIGEFILGADFKNAYGGSSIGRLPIDLVDNGSFVAVRIMEQFVDRFETSLRTAARQTGWPEELIAAKLMGRYRDGRPLVPLLDPAPGTGSSAAATPAELNRFDYAPTRSHPQVTADWDGRLCPIGAHIRRMNPRGSPTMGKPYGRRLIRRGMSYEWARNSETVPTIERGLFGLFICSDLDRQYESVLRLWANGDRAAPGIRGTRDPFIGRQCDSGTFTLRDPHSDQQHSIRVPQLVETRGSIYLLLPGIRALRRLAGLEVSHAAPSLVPSPLFDPDDESFDPDSLDIRQPALAADPYPYYRWFRRHCPIRYVSEHESHWVFSAALIKELTGPQAGVFLKRPLRERWQRGLFFLDPPTHKAVRQPMDSVMAEAFRSAGAVIQEALDRVLNDMAHGAQVDAVAAFSRRLPHDVFMTLFGLSGDARARADELCRLNLLNRSPGLGAHQWAQASIAAAGLERLIVGELHKPPGHLPPASILGQIAGLAALGNIPPGEWVLTAVHLIMGGYLSTEFLLSSGLYHLLQTYGQASEIPRPDGRVTPAMVRELLRYDAPFQLADRYAARDVPIQTPSHGTHLIRQNERVVLVYGSANRDEAEFGGTAHHLDLNRFTTERVGATDHFAFGLGDHSCIGARLAVLIAGEGLTRLLERYPQMSLAQGFPPVWHSDPYFRYLMHLQVSLG